MAIISFEAEPYTIGSWTILRLPRRVSAQLPSRGQTMVKGTINGFTFQTALEPDGEGSHWLHVDTRFQKSAGVHAGAAAKVSIEPSKEWPEPALPADWKTALNANPQVHALWKRITPMARWEWIRWIGSSSNPETRMRRISVASSKLLHGERRPCCFNRNMCCVPEVSKRGVLLGSPA